MKTIYRNILSRYFPWALIPVMFLSASITHAQASAELSQEAINARVAEIINHGLQVGVITTPEGVRATPMKAHVSLQEQKEIKAFGERAIMPLSQYLELSDYRAQHLVVNMLGYIGGKKVVKPLTYAAERSDSPDVRSAAVNNLAQEPWADVADIIERIAVNDTDPFVKRDAQAIIAKHQPVSEQQK